MFQCTIIIDPILDAACILKINVVFDQSYSQNLLKPREWNGVASLTEAHYLRRFRCLQEMMRRGLRLSRLSMCELLAILSRQHAYSGVPLDGQRRYPISTFHVCPVDHKACEGVIGFRPSSSRSFCQVPTGYHHLHGNWCFGCFSLFWSDIYTPRTQRLHIQENIFSKGGNRS